MMSGVTNAQFITKSVAHAKIIAEGGYYLSSCTLSGSIEAMTAARKFGCYASSCTVIATNDDQFMVCFGWENKQPDKNMTQEQILRDKEFKVMRLDDYFAGYAKATATKDRKQSNEIVFDLDKGKKEELKDKMCFMLVFNPFKPNQQEKLISLLKKQVTLFDLRKKVEFASSDLSFCRALAENFKDIPVTFMMGNMSPKELSKRAGKIGCAYDYETLHNHPNWLKEAESLGMPIMVCKVQNEHEVSEMLSKGVERFMTENVALVSAWAEKKPLVKLMSFNIRMSGMSEYDGINAWGNRKEAVVRMLREQNPDVLGVQEMLPDQQQYLRNELRDYRMVGVGREDGMQEGECMGIFYKKDRFALEDSGTFWLSQTPDRASMGWDAACKRTVTYVRLKDRLSGKRFYYFNTHMDHVGVIARQESVKLMAERIREIVRDTSSVFILGGDMNSTIADPIFIPLLGDPSKERKALSDMSESKRPVMEMTEGRIGGLMKICRSNAWQRDNLITYNGYGKDKVSQIDHLFSSCETENLIFQTDKKDYGVPYISDHYPITLIFSLK